MSTVEHLPVQIGQVKIGRAGQSLNAILGSCIGLGFMLRHKGVYGLAHALLPQSRGVAEKGQGRGVDQAIQSLLSMMELTAQDRRDLRVFLAGGANMTMRPGADRSKQIGTLNAKFALQAVKEARLHLIHNDLGGDYGRRVVIDCDTGDYTIDTIPRLGTAT